MFFFLLGCLLNRGFLPGFLTAGLLPITQLYGSTGRLAEAQKFKAQPRPSSPVSVKALGGGAWDEQFGVSFEECCMLVDQKTRKNGKKWEAMEKYREKMKDLDGLFVVAKNRENHVEKHDNSQWSGWEFEDLVSLCWKSLDHFDQKTRAAWTRKRSQSQSLKKRPRSGRPTCWRPLLSSCGFSWIFWFSPSLPLWSSMVFAGVGFWRVSRILASLNWGIPEAHKRWVVRGSSMSWAFGC